MPIMPENPCAEHHQELALMTNCTTFRDVNTTLRCNRCGETMTFEAAVRNDERMKIVRTLQALHDRLDETDVWENEGRGYLAEAVGLARRDGEERTNG